MVSIIITCRNEGENIKNTLNSLTTAPVSYPYEIVVVDDGSNDNCCAFLHQEKWQDVKLVTTEGVGISKARNLGATKANGEILIFCDAHIFVDEFWLDQLLEVLKEPGVGAVSPAVEDVYNPKFTGYGLGWRNPIEVDWLSKPGCIKPVPVLPGGFLAIWQDVFNEIGGFDEGLKKFFHEDMELTTKIWLFGYEALVIPDIKIRHIFRQRPKELSFHGLYYNVLRIAFYHFKTERIKKLISYLNRIEGFARDYADIVLDEDVWQKRERYFKHRKHDDDWLTQKFKIPF